MSCYKVFECLGFTVTGAQVSHADAIAHLMSGQEEPKHKKLEAIWETVTSFCHLGRHDGSAPVPLTHADGELAVVSPTVLLRYLANPQP
jgi:hypothetical protein